MFTLPVAILAVTLVLQVAPQPQQQPVPANCPKPGTKPDPNNPPPANCPKDPNANKPAPLFGGTLALKKSRQSTDSTALGFNGIGDNGQVTASVLSASSTSDAAAKAQRMANFKPDPAALAKFQKDGNLTPPASAPKQ
jgi:hypothetical protein